MFALPRPSLLADPTETEADWIMYWRHLQESGMKHGAVGERSKNSVLALGPSLRPTWSREWAVCRRLTSFIVDESSDSTVNTEQQAIIEKTSLDAKRLHLQRIAGLKIVLLMLRTCIFQVPLPGPPSSSHQPMGTWSLLARKGTCWAPRWSF
jgi:hypothetical protein